VRVFLLPALFERVATGLLSAELTASFFSGFLRQKNQLYGKARSKKMHRQIQFLYPASLTGALKVLLKKSYQCFSSHFYLEVIIITFVQNLHT
jgi:hypothetical protein